MPRHVPPPLQRLARTVSLRALLSWSVAAALLLPFLGRLDRELRAISAVSGSESAQVARVTHAQFDTHGVSRAVLVMSGLRDSVNNESGRAEVRRLIQPLLTLPQVVTVASPATLLDTMLLGRDRHSAIAIVGVNSEDPAVIATLRDITRDVVTRERPQNAQLRMQWTGQSAFVADLRTAGAGALREAERLAVPLTIVVALIAFGSLRLVIVAFAAAAIVMVIASGASGALSSVLPPSALTKPIISIMGFALTMDYALLLTRWPGPVAAVRPAVRAVRMAGAAVACGFVGLTIAPTGELRSAAAVGALVALLASAVTTTLLERDAEVRPTNTPIAEQRWRRWGTFVTRHPWPVLVVSLVPLLALALQALDARLVTPISGWLPASAEASQSIDELERMQRSGVAGTSTVLLTLPVGVAVLSPTGWTALRNLGDAARRLPDAGDVRSLATIGTGELLVAQQVIPARVQRTYVATNGHQAILEAIPSPRADANGAVRLVSALRTLDVATVTGVPGASIQVGGLPAYVVDYERALRLALPWIVAATALASLLALLVLLRAPVVACKAIVLNLLVAAAAMGATVLVFQRGFGVSLFGHQVLGSIFPTVPVLAFGASFGVSMDYELFLLSGVRDARARGASHEASIVEGLVTMGGTITRAAAVMIGVFLAFAFNSMLPLAMIGFTLAVVVVLDASLVRLALAPATLALAGRFNWWPERLST